MCVVCVLCGVVLVCGCHYPLWRKRAYTRINLKPKFPSLQEQGGRISMQKMISEGYAAIGALATMSEGWVACMAAGPFTGSLLLLLASGLSE